MILNEYNYKGVYIHYINGSENLEKYLFCIYLYITKNVPASQNILLCSKDISNEELTAFLYRALLCEYNACFIIGGIESLESDKRVKFLSLLNNILKKKNRKIESCLILLYTDEEIDIYKTLISLTYIQLLDIKEKNYVYKWIKKEELNYDLTYSSKFGIGKSKDIELNIKILNKKYIYFPFGGFINRKDIFERIKNLEAHWLSPECNPKDCAIHLDIYDSDQIDLMTEFLISILITKLYGHGEDMFYFPKEIEIHIEIPNEFFDIKEKFKILDLFSGYSMGLQQLITENDINSNVQIVANFLQLMENEKEFKKFSLYFEGLTPYSFSLYLDNGKYKKPKILDAYYCHNLILNKVKQMIPEPNYYQIKSFIDIFATQLKSFIRNFTINEAIVKGKELGFSIKSIILESYIKITECCIKGAFFDLIDENKKKTCELKNYFDEALQKLSSIKTNLIYFDKFSYPIIFFHEGTGEGFSIIKSIKNDSDNKNLYELYNCQCQKDEDKKPLPDYNNYNQIDFLKELKNILDIKNLATIKEKEMAIKDIEEKITKTSNNERIKDWQDDIKRYKSRQTLEEIVGKYVFTADNFFKMILIYL